MFALAGVLLATPAQGHEDEGAVMRRACTDLVLDYALYRDRRDAGPWAELFTEDAELVVLGETFQGRANIRSRLEQNADGAVTRHMMSTIRITPGAPGTATGVSYVTVYQGSATAPGPIPVENFAAVGEYHDRFRLTPEGWKIARREFLPAFMPAPAAAPSRAR